MPDAVDELVEGARGGDAAALDQLVRSVKDDVYNLAVRMLWHPADAEDATQEILIKVITSLAGFRGESSLRTWVFRVASNHLLTTRRRRAERPELTFVTFGDDLARGLDTPYDARIDERLLEEEVKIGCTQGMLLCLDREHRLAYILGEVFELPSEQAASVVGITPAAYRKRLSRARERIQSFMRGHCGIVDPANACRCRRRIGRAIELDRIDQDALLFAGRPARAVRRGVEEMDQLHDAAAVFRSHPEYEAPERLASRLAELVGSGRFPTLTGPEASPWRQDRRMTALEDGIVETAADARELSLPPLVILDRIEAFLDERGLGSGPVRARRIGVPGGSNFTFLLERDTGRYVLRRPPRPPLPPSAHDMVREARLQLALAKQGIRVPPIVAVCEDAEVTGAPFYVMEYFAGDVIDDDLPRHLAADHAARRRVGFDLVDTLVEIHEADVSEPDLAAFVRPGSYAERQVRRFMQLWPLNATRELPVPEVGERLGSSIPEPLPLAVVHGDYRIGNVMVGADSARIVAVLDWEMGAIGDPRADLGYLVATYTEPGGAANALGTSPATAAPGFPSRAELVGRYEERSGRRVERLGWFEALALWKAAVFCEAIYGRFIRGELGDAPQAARFEEGVPRLVEAAAEALERDERERP